MEFITQVAPDLTWICELCTKEMRADIEYNCVKVTIIKQTNYGQSDSFKSSKRQADYMNFVRMMTEDMAQGFRPKDIKWKYPSDEDDEELLGKFKYYGLSDSVLRKHLDILRIINARMDK